MAADAAQGGNGNRGDRRSLTMERLRATFQRSRVRVVPPSPSLEVPKQVRSASFDEIRLKNEEEMSGSLLDVPSSRNQRSRSFDSATPPETAAETSKWRLLRRISCDRNPVQCVHCLCMDEYLSQNKPDFRSSDPPEEPLVQHDDSPTYDERCQVTVTVSTTTSGENTPDEQSPTDIETPTESVSSLEVPKQMRSASLDSSFLSVPGREKIDDDCQRTQRSRSVDIVLPTDDMTDKKAFQGQLKVSMGNGETRLLRSTPDWEESAINGDHLWVNSSASGDLCYLTDNDCSKQGPRMRCPSCKITAHTRCITILIEKLKFPCKPTFKDVGVRQYREQTVIHHHWVHRRSQKGKCNQCGKSFQSKLPFGAKQEVLAVSCSWCKTAYHIKGSCFNMQRIGEQCTMGIHANIIVPPSWIVKLPRKGSFKSSLRRSPKKRASSKKKPKKEGEKELPKTFVIKPIPSVNSKPLLVFINPKSGGNQGAKLMQKFQWLLNPRQVFDLSQGGPTAGLELYKKVPNLRILACGGDGTAGWVLSVLDDLGISPQPPLAVLPLGTGNDLARSLGWGGGYTDEPISKILINVQEGDVMQLDRWDLSVEKNVEVDPSQCEEGKEYLPLNVVNNYFSLGVDAHIALEFHEAREARPDKFNSRLRNKMFYGQAGGKDLLQRKWKDLCNYMTLECDDQDLTPRLRELRVHSVLFLNIPSYGGGTHPWGNPATGFESQSTDDGLIEVIGLTTYQLPFLQAGGHGTCLAQCRKAKLITTRTIPMQVDGEPCRLLPSIIELSPRNQANIVAKAKRHDYPPRKQTLDKLTLDVRKLTMSDYETYHYCKEKLKEASSILGSLYVDQDTDLQEIRSQINQLLQNETKTENEIAELVSDWCFLDSCTAERFFRIDYAQEHLHYVVDICADELFILEQCETDVAQSPFTASSECPLVNSAVCEDELLYPYEPEDQNAFLKNLRVESEDATSSTLELSQEILDAAKSGDLTKLQKLHECGCSLLSADEDGMTVLHYAAELGYKDMIRYLIACVPRTALDTTDNIKGQTPLHKAALNRHRTICCMLVSAGACLTSLDNENRTPRQLAEEAEYTELAYYLESQERFSSLGREKETAV